MYYETIGILIILCICIMHNTTNFVDENLLLLLIYWIYVINLYEYYVIANIVFRKSSIDVENYSLYSSLVYYSAMRSTS